jgi:ribosomal protein S18 acetylase RimI-like enzyme
MEKILNGRFFARPGSLEDVPIIHRLWEKQLLHYHGVFNRTISQLTNRYSSPGFDPAQNLHLVFDLDKNLVANIELWDDENPPVLPYIRFVVDPDLENEGLEEYLLEWGEKNSLRALDRVPPEFRVAMVSEVYHNIESSWRAMERTGMKLIRHDYRMMIEMEGPPPEPIWPEGISLRKYDPDIDALKVFQVVDEVFEDHFGYIKEPEEEAYKRFMHHLTGTDAYDPTLWILAMDGEKIAGICISRKFGDEGMDTGHVSILGVRRPWRRKGLGLALLQYVFGEFFKRGKFKVELGVDAESLTGATDLYIKAGMHVLRRRVLYEKELRPGKDVSVTSLESSEG